MPAVKQGQRVQVLMIATRSYGIESFVLRVAQSATRFYNWKACMCIGPWLKITMIVPSIALHMRGQTQSGKSFQQLH